MFGGGGEGYDKTTLSTLGVFSKIIKEAPSKKDDVSYKVGSSLEAHLGMIGAGISDSVTIEESPQEDAEK